MFSLLGVLGIVAIHVATARARPHGSCASPGAFAVQLAKALGATVTATCSPRNAALVRALGADAIVNYREEDWGQLLAGHDFDVVYDCVGGRKHWDDAQKILKPGGTFVTIVGDRAAMGLSGFLGKVRCARQWLAVGFVGGSWHAYVNIPACAHMPQAWAVVSRFRWFSGFNYKLFTAMPQLSQLRHITEMVEAGQIRPVIDSRYAAVAVCIRGCGAWHQLVA